MPKCKPVLWPRSDYWSTHHRELNGLLLSQKSEVSEVYGSGGSLATAIYRVVVIDESGAPLLQVATSANESDADADLAWAKGFAGSDSKWKSSSKLANAFISTWNKSSKQESVPNVGKKAELSVAKFNPEAASLGLEAGLVAGDETSCRLSHLMDYFDMYGLPGQNMKPFTPPKKRGGTKAEKDMKYAICSYTVTYPQAQHLPGHPEDKYLKECEKDETPASLIKQ